MIERTELLDVLVEKLIEKEEIMSSVASLVENLDDTFSMAVKKSVIESIDEKLALAFQVDLIFVSTRERFLKANSVESLEALPREALQSLKPAQLLIGKIKEHQNVLQTHAGKLEQMKRDLQRQVVQNQQAKKVQNAYQKHQKNK